MSNPQVPEYETATEQAVAYITGKLEKGTDLQDSLRKQDLRFEAFGSGAVPPSAVFDTIRHVGTVITTLHGLLKKSKDTCLGCDPGLVERTREVLGTADGCCGPWTPFGLSVDSATLATHVLHYRMQLEELQRQMKLCASCEKLRSALTLAPKWYHSDSGETTPTAESFALARSVATAPAYQKTSLLSRMASWVGSAGCNAEEDLSGGRSGDDGRVDLTDVVEQGFA